MSALSPDLSNKPGTVPIPDPALPPGIPLPAHILSRAGTRADRSTSTKPRRTDA
jgi:hypothetical protein